MAIYENLVPLRELTFGHHPRPRGTGRLRV